MEKLRVRKQAHKHIYVHNDLSNAAFHFKRVVETKLAANDRSGIAFDYMACLLMLAFTLEAKINFLGFKLIADWRERQPFNDKLGEVFAKLNIDPDWAVRPFSSVEKLKQFRDSIAHGKPVEIETDETVILTAEEADRKVDLESDWVRYCGHDNVFDTYADIDQIWRQLLDASHLTIFDTITHGEGSLSLIKKLVETNAPARASPRRFQAFLPRHPLGSVI